MTIDQVTDAIQDATTLLTRASNALSDVINRVRSITDEHDGSNLQTGKLEDACRYFFLVTESYLDLDEVRKEISMQLSLLSRDVIPAIMEERKVRNLTLDDIQRQFVKSVRVTASMVDKDQAFDWLRANGKGEMITQTVNSSSLSAFANQYLEEHQKDLPDCFKLSTMTLTQIRKKDK